MVLDPTKTVEEFLLDFVEPKDAQIRPVPLEEIPNFPECDYDTAPTRLFKAIEEKRWKAVQYFLRGGSWPGEFQPDKLTPACQTCTWVTKYETSVDGKEEIGKWTQLPLHAALTYGAIDEVIKLLLNICPGSVYCADDRRMLPLHLAFCHGASDAIVGLLLDLFPEAVNVRDFDGRTPVDCALNGPHAKRSEIIQAIYKKYQDKWQRKQARLEAKQQRQKERITQVKATLTDKTEEVCNLKVAVDLLKWREDQTKKVLLTVMAELKDINGWYKQQENVAAKEEIVEDLATKLASLQQVTDDLMAEAERETNENSQNGGSREKLFGGLLNLPRNRSRPDSDAESLSVYSALTNISLCEARVHMNSHVDFQQDASTNGPELLRKIGGTKSTESKASFHANQNSTQNVSSVDTYETRNPKSGTERRGDEQGEVSDKPSQKMAGDPDARDAPCLDESNDILDSFKECTIDTATDSAQSKAQFASKEHSSHSSAGCPLSKDPSSNVLPPILDERTSLGKNPAPDCTISLLDKTSFTDISATVTAPEDTSPQVIVPETQKKEAEKAALLEAHPASLEQKTAFLSLISKSDLPPLHPKTKKTTRKRNPFLKTLKAVSSKLSKQMHQKPLSRKKGKHATEAGLSMDVPTSNVISKIRQFDSPSNMDQKIDLCPCGSNVSSNTGSKEQRRNIPQSVEESSGKGSVGPNVAAPSDFASKQADAAENEASEPLVESMNENLIVTACSGIVSELSNEGMTQDEGKTSDDCLGEVVSIASESLAPVDFDEGNFVEAYSKDTECQCIGFSGDAKEAKLDEEPTIEKKQIGSSFEQVCSDENDNAVSTNGDGSVDNKDDGSSVFDGIPGELSEGEVDMFIEVVDIVPSDETHSNADCPTAKTARSALKATLEMSREGEVEAILPGEFEGEYPSDESGHDNTSVNVESVTSAESEKLSTLRGVFNMATKTASKMALKKKARKSSSTKDDAEDTASKKRASGDSSHTRKQNSASQAQTCKASEESQGFTREVLTLKSL